MKTPKTPKTSKAMLAMLKRFLNSKTINRTYQREVWDILTALRGPDYEEGDDDKHATTCVIRHYALGYKACCSPYTANGSVFREDSETSVGLRVAMLDDKRSYHFYHHMADAFAALGLKWDKNNERSKK